MCALSQKRYICMIMNRVNSIGWFAVHVKRFREALAASSIEALGHPVFLPLVKVESPETEVIKVASRALFPGYLFAQFCPSDALSVVESARGVLYVIKSGTRPICVDDRVVQEIRDRASEDGLIELGWRKFKAGDRVSIQEGPLAGMMGRVEAEPDGQKRVRILLETLWNARVQIEKRCVEVEAG